MLKEWTVGDRPIDRQLCVSTLKSPISSHSNNSLSSWFAADEVLATVRLSSH